MVNKTFLLVAQQSQEAINTLFDVTTLKANSKSGKIKHLARTNGLYADL